MSHLSEAEEFDALEQNLKQIKTGGIFYVPGEHDVLSDNGALYRERFGKKTLGAGWYSFDKNGVHFVGLVNVVNIREGGLGVLGAEQLDWLKKDLAPLPASTPIVVFAHIPLWAVYPQWGWGTDDAEQALGFLRRFGSVTVLNGHIHQTVKKVEGNITFHTAMSTAFPQPAPGTAPKPGPMKVDAGRLSSVLGITDVNYVEKNHTLAVVDSTLALTRKVPSRKMNSLFWSRAHGAASALPDRADPGRGFLRPSGFLLVWVAETPRLQRDRTNWSFSVRSVHSGQSLPDWR